MDNPSNSRRTCSNSERRLAGKVCACHRWSRKALGLLTVKSNNVPETIHRPDFMISAVLTTSKKRQRLKREEALYREKCCDETELLRYEFKNRRFCTPETL